VLAWAVRGRCATSASVSAAPGVGQRGRPCPHRPEGLAAPRRLRRRPRCTSQGVRLLGSNRRAGHESWRRFMTRSGTRPYDQKRGYATLSSYTTHLRAGTTPNSPRRGSRISSGRPAPRIAKANARAADLPLVILDIQAGRPEEVFTTPWPQCTPYQPQGDTIHLLVPLVYIPKG
jgi:hypothetical protein